MLFYKESSIRNSFKCRKCLISLDEHKPPRLMPCGKKALNDTNFLIGICENICVIEPDRTELSSLERE